MEVLSSIIRLAISFLSTPNILSTAPHALTWFLDLVLDQYQFYRHRALQAENRPLVVLAKFPVFKLVIISRAHLFGNYPL